VLQRLRYYVNGDYSEVRFFRHNANLKYVPGRELHPIYPRPIRMKHFANRSPDQIRTRLSTRREPMQRGEFLHEKRVNWAPDGRIIPGPAKPEDLPQSWDERVADSAECHYDQRDGTYAQPEPWVPPDAPTWGELFRSRTDSLMARVRAILGTNI
jgi:hypothetical protein